MGMFGRFFEERCFLFAAHIAFVAYLNKRSWFERWDGDYYTGEYCSEKINRIREKMFENGGK